MKERVLSGMLILLAAFPVTVCGQDRLEGTTGVTATGGATYTVQIETPKGVGDLQPSIALTYNSQSGNGVAGWGCNITGVSVITRGMRDIYHDGTPNGIKYTADDALYLDGKRLIRVSGVNGADGSVYSPEGEPLTKVKLHGSSVSTGSWLEVDTNDGMTYEFGHATGSQQVIKSVPMAWYISKGTNPVGQSITYQYLTADWHLYPQTVTYGGDNTVRFEYETRGDTIPFVLNGQKGYVGKRLRRISCNAGSSVFRTYTMAYDTSSDASTTRFSRLTGITETGVNSSESRKITLDWNYLPAFSAPSTSTGITFPEDDNLHEYGEHYLMAGDFNGDGVSDIVHISPVKEYTYHYENASHWSYYTYAHIYRSSVSGGVASFQSPVLFRFPENISIGDWTFQKGGMCVADIDGDGINDLILPGSTNATPSGRHAFYFHYALGKDIASNSTLISQMGFMLTNSYELPLYSITDIDCDGKSDLIVLEKQHANGKYLCHIAHINAQESVYDISLTLTGKPRKLFTGDYNGDGMADMLVVCDDGYRIFYGQGGAVSAGSFTDSSALVRLSDVHHRMDQGDFNGDGIPDFVWNDHHSNKLYFSLGNGDGTFTRRIAYTFPTGILPKNTDKGTWNCLVVDLDHDGKSDVVVNTALYAPTSVFMRTTTLWLTSDGNKLTQRRTATSSREDDAKAGHICAGDFRGLGFPEVMNYGYDCWAGNNANVSPSLRIYRSSAQGFSDGRVKSAKNSNGRVTALTYSTMTSDKVYTKGTGSTYPVIDVAAPLCVVSQVRESGASSVIRQTSYTYKGLRYHLRGRGVIGFTEQSSKETYTGLRTTTAVTGWDTQRFLPLKTLTTTAQGGYSSTSEQTGTVVSFGSNYMVFPSSLRETDIHGNVTTTAYTYNTTLGCLTRKRTEYGGSNMYRQTEYAYSPDKTGRAYRPVTVRESQKHCDDAQAYITTTKYTYNSSGLPIRTVVNDGTPLALTTEYAYDSYGNVTRETVSGAGITTPMVTNYQYSAGKFLTQRSTSSSSVTYGRNPFGEVMALVDLTTAGPGSLPLITNYTRDSFGRVTKEVRPTGEEITYSRSSNSNGYAVTRTQAGGGTVTTQYDALDNELSTETKGVAGTVIKTTSTYNARGLLAARAHRKGGLTVTESMAYDALGRLTSLSSTSGKSVKYSYGNRTRTTTDHGRQYVTTTDAWGGVTESADPLTSVTYTYHSNGKPSSVSSEGSTVYMEYDAAGNQTSLDDPDAGITSYEYDALGRVVRQTDARGYETTSTYDAIGRLVRRECGGVATTYAYGTEGYAKERLVREQTADRVITYDYDSKGRLSSETRSMSGETPVTSSYQYDSKGRLSSKTFPKGVTVNYKYNSFGMQSGCDIGGHCIGLVTQDDGKTTTVQYGGTLQTDLDLQVQNPALTHTTEHDNRGYLTGLWLRKSNDPSVLRGMTFSFDGATGNLGSRTGMMAQEEKFDYDDLDRLERVRQGNSTAMRMTYADNGNITEKTYIGTLHYEGERPHAVTSVDNDLGYIPSATQQATYTAFGKVETLTDGDYSMTVTYGPDGERWKTVLMENGSVKRTTFYAGDYERITENGITRHFYYLDNGCVYVLQEGQSSGTYYYALTDHLGSVTRIYDESGASVFEADYDAWGRQAVSKNTIGFHRGYTGHEMLPEFGLINMNGRLYDPMLGRFLSPDNFVQMPDFSQSFNRYSYCINNPLKFNDPDGEIAWWVAAALVGGIINVATNASDIDSFGDFLGYFGVGAIAGIGGAYVGGMVAGAIGVGGFIGGAATGFAGGAVGGFTLGSGNSIVANGWDLDAALKAGVDGMITSAVSGALIGGAVGGYSAYKQGTDFWTGKPNSLVPQVELNYEEMDALAPKMSTKDLSVSSISVENNISRFSPFEKGKIGVEWAKQEFIEDGGIIYGEQITIEIDGVRIRPDFVGYKDDILHIYEVKNGPYAGFTKNQKLNIPKLLDSKPQFYFRGGNASQYPRFRNLIINKRPYTGNYNFVIKHYY